MKEVLSAITKKWTNSARTKTHVAIAYLSDHYLNLFHSKEEQVPQPDLSDLKLEHKYSIDELLKAKSKLKTLKSPGLNDLRSELLK